jgi:hypothetical protein
MSREFVLVQERDGKKLPSASRFPNCLLTQGERALIDHGGCKERPPHSYFPTKSRRRTTIRSGFLAKIGAFVRYDTPSD